MPSNVLDTAFGLHCVGGNKVLYSKLLGDFIVQQGDAPAKIEKALEQGEIEVAHRMAHTLKGVSASLGITAVQQCATELDAAFRLGQDGSDILPLLKTAVQEALVELATFRATA